jgi:phosphate acyltransferase
MSGDHGLRSSIPASLKFLQEHPALHLHLIGDQASLSESFSAVDPQSFSFVHSTDVIPMDASVREVLRARESSSSMQLALDLVAAGECQGIISAGNTGALMALAMRTLGMRDGYSRPALCAAVPTLQNPCFMLDLGANVDCQAEQLLEFALLGHDLATGLSARGESGAGPRVALLSNGSEPGKGNEQTRRAYELMQEHPEFNFIGNIEASEIQQGAADVLVCDGFTGNIALKAMEGTGRYLRQILGSKQPALDSIMNPQRYNGALMLGLNGVVVKSHGGADSDGFYAALIQALQCTQESA